MRDMANKEHLRILKQGVDAWNKWRHWNQEVEPDLSGANLQALLLINADLKDHDAFEAEFDRLLEDLRAAEKKAGS